MKKILPILLAVFLIVSCGNDDDNNNNDTGIFGVWNVIDTYQYNDCNGQPKTFSYEYQISIDEYNSDSIIIVNLLASSFPFKGIFSGSSLSFDSGLTGSSSCSGSGIFQNNSISFSLNCSHSQLYNEYTTQCNVPYLLTPNSATVVATR